VVTITGPGMLLTRSEAAEVARVSKERIRAWERNGHLERAGLNEAGQPVYEAVAVAKAQRKLDRFTRVSAAA
jgi:DNA-binding transcriptional MerR regulator